MAATFSAAMSLIFLLILSISSPSVKGTSAPAVVCSTVVSTNLVTCMPFVMIGSTADKPRAACCMGLKKMLDTNPECLCEAMKPGGMMGVNVTKAETLPAACKLTAPPVSSCTKSPTPASAPAPVPAGGPRSAYAPAPRPSHGSSLIPISGMSFVISGTLAVLLSHI